MTTNSRKLETTGRGGAHYFFTNHEPAEWLVASIPGAAEAREAWHAENAKGEELYRAYKAAQKAAPATQWNGEPGSAVPGPAHGVTQAAWEAGQAAVRAAEATVDAQAKKALAALRRFDALAHSGLGTPEEYKAAAAAHALRKHEEAAAAWEALKAALAEREQAHASAGSPGRDWRNAAPIGYRSLANAETIVRPMIEGFDVAALKLAAEGQRVPSSAEIAAEALRAAKESDAKAAAATRRRSAKEGY